MIKTLSFLLAAGVATSALVLSGCGETKVDRVDPNTTIDLSGYWNDSDAQRVAKALIDDSMSKPWASNFKAKNNRDPVVMLGKVIVRANSGDDINTAIFLKAIRKEFVNSGRIDVVDEDASQGRAEVADQAVNAEKGKDAGKEIAADFLLKGTINVQDDQEGSRKVKFYRTDLELTDVQTRKIAWTGDHPIKKDVTNAKNKF